MRKLLQNRIAESETTLFVCAFYAILVWFLAGVISKQWWLQMGCIALTTYLILELNNNNALIRVRSRMVSYTFLVLTTAAPSLFHSLRSSILYVCIIAALHLLFQTYQEEKSAGRMFFAFLFIGLASFLTVQILFFVPVLWLLIATQLQSLNRRTWITSCFGLILPYWLATPILVFQRSCHLATAHFAPLIHVGPPFDFSRLTMPELSIVALSVFLSIVSMIHLWQKSYEDRIRTRQLYSIFSTIFLLTTAYLMWQPMLFEALMPVFFICASPLIAHFFALTSSKFTNTLFIVSLVLILSITLSALYPTLLSQFIEQVHNLWNG